MMALKATLTRILGLISIILFSLLVVVTVWQVASRQLFNSPSTWSEELAKILFVWLAFTGAAFLFGERGHIAVDFLARKLPVRLQRILQLFVQLCIFIFAVLAMVWGGYLAANIAWNQNLTALPLTIGWVYVVIPVTGVCIALFAVMDLIGVGTGREPAYPHVDEADEPRDIGGPEQEPDAPLTASEGRNP